MPTMEAWGLTVLVNTAPFENSVKSVTVSG